MRMLLVVLMLFLGCTQAPEKQEVEPTPTITPPIKTRPAPRRDRPKRMYASTSLVVAVVDTGFGVFGNEPTDKLCDTGHKNFSEDKEMINVPSIKDPIPKDNHGHGTNIVGIIDAYGGDGDYCIVVIKFYSPKAIGENNLKNSIAAFQYANEIGADIINYSGGGTESSKEEGLAIKNFLDRGGIFVAAAGNERSDLAASPYYPATEDDRIVVVGAVDSAGNKIAVSNFGKRVDRWEIGKSVAGYGIVMTGTSQATAVATGKIIKRHTKKSVDYVSN